MVNIIANKTVYEEYIQHFATPETLAASVEKILPEGERRKFVLEEIDYITKQYAHLW